MSGDETLNPVLHTTFCWTFRTRDPQFSKPDPRSLSFQTKLTPLQVTTVVTWTIFSRNCVLSVFSGFLFSLYSVMETPTC